MPGNRRKGAVLQPRDFHLLNEIGRMRLVDLEQAQVIGKFGSYQRTHARMDRLAKAGMLQRFYIGTVALGRKCIYGLSAKAAELVGSEFKRIQRRQGQLLVGDLFVHHQLHVNQIYLAVKYQAIPFGESRFISWKSFHKPLSQSVLLTPDGYFEIAAEQVVRSMFVEVDLGTETRTVWEQKIRAYLQLAISGEFERLFTRKQFRVLVVAPTRNRVERIRAVAAKLTDKIFWFSSFEVINCDGFWSSVWLRPKGDQVHSLS